VATVDHAGSVLVGQRPSRSCRHLWGAR
jgi:hypothetical protein